MQQKQEEFYTTWVREMIRIAKKGAPVIVESVSSPLCEAPFDWDAVSRQFWKVSVTLLPVEENSLDFGIDKIYPERTHVHFRKSR